MNTKFLKLVFPNVIDENTIDFTMNGKIRTTSPSKKITYIFGFDKLRVENAVHKI